MKKYFYFKRITLTILLLVTLLVVSLGFFVKQATELQANRVELVKGVLSLEVKSDDRVGLYKKLNALKEPAFFDETLSVMVDEQLVYSTKGLLKRSPSLDQKIILESPAIKIFHSIRLSRVSAMLVVSYVILVLLLVYLVLKKRNRLRKAATKS
jgi:preprotein translocase subunit SecG